MTVKQILYSLQNCSLGQSAARAPTPATPHHPQFPHKMRRRHLESVSSRSLSVRGSWGAATSVFWYGAPGGTRGPLGKGGAAERWRVVYPIGIATRHGAKPATTRTYKSRPPPGRRTGRHPPVTLPRRRRLQSCPKISFAYFSSQKSSPCPLIAKTFPPWYNIKST